MNCVNTNNCPCPKDCENHGRCCDCIARHRGMGNMVFCMFPYTDGKRDAEHVYTKLKERFEM